MLTFFRSHQNTENTKPFTCNFTWK